MKKEGKMDEKKVEFKLQQKNPPIYGWCRKRKNWDFIIVSICVGMMVGFVLIVWLILWWSNRG